MNDVSTGVKKKFARGLLKALIVAGMLVIPVGPCARISNEGFGDPPGPIARSRYWQRVSYVLIPVGAALAVGAAVALVILDRKHP